MSALECRVGQCSETWWDQLGRAQGKWSGDSMAHLTQTTIVRPFHHRSD